MITIKEVKQVLYAFSKHNGSDNPLMVTNISMSDGLNYNSSDTKRYDICKAAREGKATKKLCLEYYSDLDTDQISDGVCPFGILHKYIKTSDGPLDMIASSQYEWRMTENVRETVGAVGRQDNKLLTKMLITPKPWLSGEQALNKVEFVYRLRETLLSGRIAATIRQLSHHLLTPVQGAVNDLQSLLDGDMNARFLLEQNLTETYQISRRIHLLLAHSNRVSPNSLRKVVIHDVIKQISARLKNSAEEKRLIINIGYNAGITRVQAVPDQMEQLFSIMIENAVKYSFEGFVDKLGTINVSFKNHKSGILVSIGTLGCYITDEEIRERKLFLLSYRGLYSGDRNRQGTGSGLYLADTIVKAHSGSIEIERQDVQGNFKVKRSINTFKIYIPEHQSD